MAMEFLTSLFSFLVIITSTRAEVSLVPSNNVSLCFGGSITLRCMTTEQSLLWTSNAENRLFNDINQPTTTLGNFTLNVVSVTSNGTSLSVTSTATLVNFQFTSSGLKIECKELMTLSLSMEATLIAAGPPPPPQNLIIQEGIIENFTVSWSQSNCAVQYVVTIINSSNDRVYLNISTSNTNTTVTLPTGVEFCVTLVAVDSIGRRGPDTTPVCYSQAITKYSTVTPSSTVTHSPGMMGGVNVAVVVAIPVVLVLLLLLVIGVVVGVTLLLRKHKPRKGDNIKSEKDKEYVCKVFCKKKGVNRWKFVLIFLLKSEIKKVGKDFAGKGYAKESSKVSLHMLTTNESIRIETADITSESEWHVEFDHQQVIKKADLEIIANTDPEITKYSYIRAKITAFTECTSPDDLHFSVNLVGTTSSTKVRLIDIKKNAEKRCVCQVCYAKPSDNCWQTTFVFLPEKMLEKLEDLEHYQDANFGETFFFYFQTGEIMLSAKHQSEKWKMDDCSQDKVSRAAVEGYTGEGEPPCIVMTFRAVSDETTLPDLSLPVVVSGAQEFICDDDGNKVENNIIKIKRAAEFSAELEPKISFKRLVQAARLMHKDTKYICQVLSQKIKSQNNNSWKITLAFVPNNRLNEMKQIYQHLHFVKEVYVSFTFLPTAIKLQDEAVVSKGWKVTVDESYREVRRYDVASYTGKDEPPCIVMILTADCADVDDAVISMTFTGIKETNNKLEFSIKGGKFATGSYKVSSV